MSEALTVLLAAVGAVAAILAVLVPVVMLQGKNLRREITLLSNRVDANATALAGVRAEVTDLRADMAANATDLRANMAANATDLRADIAANAAALRADLAEVRRELHTRMDSLTARVDAVSERTARIEGALTGPWGPPANGNPAPTSAAPSGAETAP